MRKQSEQKQTEQDVQADAQKTIKPKFTKKKIRLEMFYAGVLAEPLTYMPGDYNISELPEGLVEYLLEMNLGVLVDDE